MVKLGHWYTQGQPHALSKNAEESPGEAMSISICTTTLSRIPLISFSNQLRSTEVVPLTPTTYDESLHTSANYHIKPSLGDSSYADERRKHPFLGAPCACRDTTLLANATEDHAACMEQLLYNPSLQGRTWRMFGSVVNFSPFASGAQGAQYCYGRAGGYCSGSDVTEMLTLGSMVITAHKDYRIRVWKLSTSPSCKHKLLNTLPTLRDCFLHCFCERNYIQLRRHHRCLWMQHVDNISAFTVGGKNDESVDHELLYSASWDKTFKVWRLSDFKCMESVMAHNDAINAIISGRCSLAAVHQELIYTASSDGTVKAWSKEGIKTSKRLKRSMKIRHRLVATLPDHKCAVNALAISSDGTVLFSAGSDGMIRVWKRSDNDYKIASAQCAHMTLCRILEGHKRAVLCLCIAGHDVLLSGSADKTLRAWSIESFKGKLSSSDDDHYDGDVDILNKCCLAILKGHKAPIKSLCASSCLHGSGYTIYTGALDMSIKVWWLQPHNY